MVRKVSDKVNWGHPHQRMTYVKNRANANFCKNLVKMNMRSSDNEEISDEITALDASEFIDATFDNCEFALDVRMFDQHQKQDKTLQTKVNKELEKHPNGNTYTTKEVEGIELIHENDKILVPATLQERVLDWYHTILVHPGENRMEQSIRSIYTWKGLKDDVKQYCKTCDICQRCKRTRKKKYGLLPEKKGEVTKWSRVNVDLWGPKTVKNKNGWDYKIHVMTMVDPVTGWFEQAQLYGNSKAY